MNSDGSLDASFNPGTGLNGALDPINITLSVQDDGKIIVGGDFTSYNGSVARGITRINSDGTIDTSFKSGTGAIVSVWATSIQGDGKIIMGGGFTNYNGIAINRIARLNMNGTLDTTFNVGIGVNSHVFTTAIQSDGKIIIAGNFTSYNGVNINRCARINLDGSLDSTFNVGTGFNGRVNTIDLQSNGKLVIGGMFTSCDGNAVNRIARLNIDGSFDSTFDVGSGFNSTVNSISIQSNGTIIVGGNFDTYDDIENNFITCLNSDGSLNLGFNVGIGTDSYVFTTLIQSNGSIILGGYFKKHQTKKSEVFLFLFPFKNFDYFTTTILNFNSGLEFPMRK